MRSTSPSSRHINVGGAVFMPGEFVQAVQNGRSNILGALNQPVGPPTTPTGATNVLQVVSVEAINVTTAVAFQVGELLLAGMVQVADAAAQELAQSGDPGAAVAAGGHAGGSGRQRGERARGLCREHRGDEHPQFTGRSVPGHCEVDGTIGPNADGQDRRAQGGSEEDGPARDQDGIRKPKRAKGLGSRDRHEQGKCRGVECRSSDEACAQDSRSGKHEGRRPPRQPSGWEKG